MAKNKNLPSVSARFACALLVLLMISVSSVNAGVNVWTDTTIAPGVKWRSKIYTNLFGGKQTVNVLEVDLNNSSIDVRPIKSSGCLMPTSTLGSGAGAIAAVNGGFFGGCDSLSMIKINGSVLDTNPGYKPARATLGLTSSNTALISNISSTNSWSAVTDAIGGGPNLVTNSAINVTRVAEGFDASYENRNPRTAAGITSSNKLLLITVDGRTSAGVGMTLNELATFMTYLGVNSAMNLDGGGSTTMWTSGQGIINSPSDGSQRSVESAIGIFSTATPVEVIVDNTDSDFTASSNWWTSSSTSGYLGSNYRVRSTASTSDAATWKANLPSAGSYKVYTRYTSGSNRAASAPYIVYHTGGSTTVNVNQQQNGGQWVLLGTFSMASGNSTRVALSCWTSSGTYVIADSIRLVKQ